MDYYKNPNKCREDGLNGRRYFKKNFDREIVTKKYIRVIEEVLKA